MSWMLWPKGRRTLKPGSGKHFTRDMDGGWCIVRSDDKFCNCSQQQGPNAADDGDDDETQAKKSGISPGQLFLRAALQHQHLMTRYR
mmetsp:Transcript_20593/g.30566  ORF Transcript_20593/g.30566 Transcript_20593/m.30566 type:complete len:87 (+) Transcript_20593:543-803(+)